jgi:iron complex outermembrane recepter protein
MSASSYGPWIGGATIALTLGAHTMVHAQEAPAPAAVVQQSALQEVVVTAQKREERLQDVPIAITALNVSDLQNRGITDFTGIAESNTSMNFTPYPSSSNTLILYMRGQGVADPEQITQDGSVGVYEDGFYIARPQTATFDLADVERVEVLRGPQGTLYGRNTTGGAINIISQKPTGELDFKADATLGTRMNGRALLAINLPKVAGLSAKVTLLATNIDGYVKNPGEGPNYQDFGIQRQVAGKLQLRYDEGGPFTADYFYEHYDLQSTPIYYQNPPLQGLIPGYVGSGQPNTTAYTAIPLPLSTSTSNAQGLTLSYNFNDQTTLRSLTGYRSLQSNAFQNYAQSFTNPYEYAYLGALNFTTQDVINSDEFTQELQLVGNVAKQLDYVFGLYFYREGANHLEDEGLGYTIYPFNEASSRYVVADSKSRAGYGQGTWKIPGFNEKLKLTLGARYTHDTKDATRNELVTLVGVGPIASEVNATNNLSFSKFNPAGTLAYDWTPDLMTYLRIATGYRAGGSSEAGPIGSFGITYGPEDITQYEIGLKSSWLNHTLRVNVAAFYSDIHNLQMQFDTDPTNLAIVLTQNAGTATIKGVEWESLYQPVRDLAVGLNWTYLDPVITEVTAVAGTVFDPSVNPASPYKVGDNVADLFRLPYAPRNIFDATVDYTFLHAGNGAYSAQLDYRYQERQYDSAPTGPAVPNNELYSIPGHGILNGRLTYTTDLPNNKVLRISLWGRNLTQLHYLQHIIAQGAFLPVGTPPNVTPPGYTYQSLAWAPPPTYGIDFSYGF